MEDTGVGPGGENRGVVCEAAERSTERREAWKEDAGAEAIWREQTRVEVMGQGLEEARGSEGNARRAALKRKKEGAQATPRKGRGHQAGAGARTGAGRTEGGMLSS